MGYCGGASTGQLEEANSSAPFAATAATHAFFRTSTNVVLVKAPGRAFWPTTALHKQILALVDLDECHVACWCEDETLFDSIMRPRPIEASFQGQVVAHSDGVPCIPHAWPTLCRHCG